jgi:hypothetical protein
MVGAQLGQLGRLAVRLVSLTEKGNGNGNHSQAKAKGSQKGAGELISWNAFGWVGRVRHRCAFSGVIRAML